jgi:hypothetical protein
MIAGGGGLMLQTLLRFQSEERASRRAEAQVERQGMEDLRRELEELKAKINRGR